MPHLTRDAKANGLHFRSDIENVVQSIRTLEKEQEDTLNKDFNIFNETVLCTRTFAIYKKNEDYYASLKRKSFSKIIKLLPKGFDDRVKDEEIKRCLWQHRDALINRVKANGLIITASKISGEVDATLGSAYLAIGKYLQYVQKVETVAVEGLEDIQADLFQQAQDNATGLSYGVVGDWKNVNQR